MNVMKKRDRHPPVRQNKGFMKRTPPVLPVSASQGESRYCCRIIPYTS